MTPSASLGTGPQPPASAFAALVCTALRIEARAVRAGWAESAGDRPDIARPDIARPDLAIVGMRATRLDRVSEHPGPVLLLGFGGGLDHKQRPGDVVVATQLRDKFGTIKLPSAHSAAAVLRRAGIAASAGPLWCSDRIVRGAARNELAGAAIAVDMESAQVARACDARRLVVVRVVVDTPTNGLFRASLFGGPRAKRALRQVAAAFAAGGIAAAFGAGEPRASNEWITSGTVEMAAHSTSSAGGTSTAGTGKEG